VVRRRRGNRAAARASPGTPVDETTSSPAREPGRRLLGRQRVAGHVGVARSSTCDCGSRRIVDTRSVCPAGGRASRPCGRPPALRFVFGPGAAAVELVASKGPWTAPTSSVPAAGPWAAPAALGRTGCRANVSPSRHEHGAGARSVYERDLPALSSSHLIPLPARLFCIQQCHLSKS